MKIVECEQGSCEWHDARLGRPTASHFGEIVAPKTAKARTGSAPRAYLVELLGERLTRLPTQHFESAAMERGTLLEPVAAQWYATTTQRAIRHVGFVVSDCGRFGGSPDGLCEDRGIEIKCPMQNNFVEIAESGIIPDDWMMQIQGLLWLTSLPSWDFVLFTDAPGLIPQIIEVRPDLKIFAAFDSALPAFCDDLDAAEKKMRAAGHGVEAITIHPPKVFDDPFEMKTIV